MIFGSAELVGERLGNLSITGNQLFVQLTNDANGYGIAGAVRFAFPVDSAMTVKANV